MFPLFSTFLSRSLFALKTNTSRYCVLRTHVFPSHQPISMNHTWTLCVLFTVTASHYTLGPLGGCCCDVQSIAFVMCILARLTDGQRAKNEIYYQSFICCSVYGSGQINTRVCSTTHTHTHTFQPYDRWAFFKCCLLMMMSFLYLIVWFSIIYWISFIDFSQLHGHIKWDSDIYGVENSLIRKYIYI